MKRTGNTSRWLWGIAALAAAVILVVSVFFLAGGFRAVKATGETVVLEIPSGSGLRAIAQRLEQAGLIHSAHAFAALAKGRSQAGKLKAGEYAFSVGQPPGEILAMLVEGRVLVRRVTVPEGYTIFQIARTLAEAGFGEEKSILALMQSASLARKLGVSAPSLEGYLFPETYSYVKGDAPSTMLERMVRQFFSVYEQEKGAAPRAPELSLHDRLTLASICEREARVPDELPVIASVYLRRLRIKMPLQADPTVAYGLKKFDALLTRADLKTPSTYNTYLRRGLPPGPICNPGRSALRAVFQPAQTKALYFVAKDDGSHHFSENYEDHQKAVRNYRQNRRSRGSATTTP